MPLTETITIINNSGKIISTGKQLVNIFKEAKASYSEKKASIKAERAFGSLQRAQTFDVSRGLNHSHHHSQHYHQPYEHFEHQNPNYYEEDDEYYQPDDQGQRRHSQDDGRSQATSRRSRGTRHSRSTHRHDRSVPGSVPAPGPASSASTAHPDRPRRALTEHNLKTLSEVSSTTPSRPPAAYRSPYAETAPRDMALSRPTLAHYPTAPSESHAGPRPGSGLVNYTPQGPVVSVPGLPRTRSETALHKPKEKEIDMNLAYGNIPPDLASRYDLDPAYKGKGQEDRAKGLVSNVERMLEEAHCVGHSATAIIAHLQTNPDAAAAVALTLAELSTLLGKMSPAFLGVIQGGSPAVFALLASPQFLIAAGVTVGVTVVMFGGWKIVKRIREAKAQERHNQMLMQHEAAVAAAFQANNQPPPMQPLPPMNHPHPFNDHPYGGGGGGRWAQEGSQGFDEALVLEEELSTIETWRRGIVPYGEEGSVDMELISPEAERAIREKKRQERREQQAGGGDDGDLASRSGRSERSHRSHRSSRTARTSKTAKTSKTSRTSKTHRTSATRRRHEDDVPDEGEDDDAAAEGDEATVVPERKSSVGKTGEAASEAGSRRSHRSHRSQRSHRGSSSVAGPSSGSSVSKRPERVSMLAIEDGSRVAEEDEALELVLRPAKEKKSNMLKTLFKKKKDKDEKERDKEAVSAVVFR